MISLLLIGAFGSELLVAAILFSLLFFALLRKDKLKDK